MAEQKTQEEPGDLAVVLVDQWGHKGEFLRGDIVRLSDVDSSQYDVKSALDRNVVRLLTAAEIVRPPTTQSIEGGEDFARPMRAQSGFGDDVPTTVTTPQGPAEPAEFSKPTIPFTGDNSPAPHPVEISGEAPVRHPAERPSGDAAQKAPAREERAKRG